MCVTQTPTNKQDFLFRAPLLSLGSHLTATSHVVITSFTDRQSQRHWAHTDQEATSRAATRTQAVIVLFNLLSLIY